MNDASLSPPVNRNRRVNAALHPDRAWVRVLRFAVAGFVVAAVVRNTILSSTGGADSDLVQLYSMFTIQSNLAFAAVLLVGAVSMRRRLPSWWDNLRGGVAFLLVMTGLVYALFVAPPGEALSWDITWTNLALHRVAPVFALADWALITMTRRSGWGRPLAWLVYPVLYLAYTWVRGAIVDWYPYGFLDPTGAGGWPAVAAATAQVLVAFLIMAVGMHVIGRVRTSLARSRSRGTAARSEPVSART